MTKDMQAYCLLMIRRDAIIEQLESLDAEIAQMAESIENYVRENGEIFKHGYRAGLKAGEANIDTSALANQAPPVFFIEEVFEED